MSQSCACVGSDLSCLYNIINLSRICVCAPKNSPAIDQLASSLNFKLYAGMYYNNALKYKTDEHFWEKNEHSNTFEFKKTKWNLGKEEFNDVSFIHERKISF